MKLCLAFGFSLLLTACSGVAEPAASAAQDAHADVSTDGANAFDAGATEVETDTRIEDAVVDAVDTRDAADVHEVGDTAKPDAHLVACHVVWGGTNPYDITITGCNGSLPYANGGPYPGPASITSNDGNGGTGCTPDNSPTYGTSTVKNCDPGTVCHVAYTNGSQLGGDPQHTATGTCL